MKPIAIIPARSGSKGLPDKNMLFLSDKPMIFHTIDAAIDSKCFELQNIFVSTDSELYGRICEETGVSISYRDERLASDNATTYDVLADFLEPYPDNQVFVLLQPTSPLRNAKQIEEAYHIFLKHHHENVVSFSEVDKHPKLFTSLSENGIALDIIGVDKGYHRQDSQPLYYPNGAIFISTKQNYLGNKSFFTDKTFAYLMDKKTSLDIDTHDDFIHALGDIFFDYQCRELRNKTNHMKLYQEKVVSLSHKNILLGDSRMLDVNLAEFDNFSIGGVTLADLLNNLDSILESDIETVIVSLGINDIRSKHSFETITADFIQLFDKLEGKKIYVTTIAYTIFRAEGNNQLISSLNEWLNEYTLQRDIHLINIHDFLSIDGQLKYELTTDGLHFIDKVNRDFEEILKVNLSCEN